MCQAWASVNGVESPLSEARVPAGDAGLLLGWSVFDTLLVVGGEPRNLSRHLERLERSALLALVPFPGRSVLHADVAAVCRRAAGLARLRVTLTHSGTRLVTLHPVDPERWGRPVRVRTQPHCDEPTLGGAVKHGSRCAWAVAVARAAVEEVVFVDDQSRFTEGTSSAVFAVRDGELWTAPHDGTVLESTTCLDVVAGAEELGIPVRWLRPACSGWDALYIANVTRGLAPVVEVDGVAARGWEPIGRAIAEHLKSP